MDIKMLSSGSSILIDSIIPIAGIYAISGIAPSRFENTIYIGSSENMHHRIFDQHFKELERNKHNNKILQNYYNKHKKDNFVTFILEECEASLLLLKEQIYIDKYGTAKHLKSFNICNVAGKPPSALGAKRTDETKQKLSLALKGKTGLSGQDNPMWGKEFSKETRQKMSEAKKGKPPPNKGKPMHENARKALLKANLSSKLTDERKTKLSEANGKSFKILSPEGLILEGKSIRKFAKEHGLDNCCLAAVLRGINKQHKGWTKL